MTAKLLRPIAVIVLTCVTCLLAMQANGGQVATDDVNDAKARAADDIAKLIKQLGDRRDAE